MSKVKPSTLLVFAIALNFARAHVAFLGGQSGPNHLHPVHGLYVKPSSDGTTGDLYVAATEDSGVKTQWLTDQPINYLPQQLSYTSTLTTTPEEAVIANQKRAVITSPPIKYTYALPVSTEGSANAIPSATAIQYPYSIQTASPVPATEGSECSDAAATPTTPFYMHPYHLYYSQMMAAFANALNNVKESSGEEGTSTTAATTAQAPVWPYSYPVQYVMVDPSAWAKAQAAATPAQPTSTPETNTSASNETS